jgi:hypothetical protein
MLFVPTGLLLGWIAVQDFRERRISLLPLALLFLLGILNTCLAPQWRELAVRVAGNSLFAGIILVSGTLLVKIGRPGDLVSSFIGLGDFLFLLSISPLFAFWSYLVFLNTSMILILLVFGLLLLSGLVRRGRSVPLAGALALSLIVFGTLDLWLDSALFENTWLFDLLK